MAIEPKSMHSYWEDSYLSAGGDGYIDQLYELYLTNPDAVSSTWRTYFDDVLKSSQQKEPDISHEAIIAAIRESGFKKSSLFPQQNVLGTSVTAADEKEAHVLEMINAYRCLGHLQANTDPLELSKSIPCPSLELDFYGFTEQDLNRRFNVENFLGLDQSRGSLSQIYQALRSIYCRTIGFEYMYINRPEEVDWIQNRIEHIWAHFQLSKEEKLFLLKKLLDADGLEKYLGNKYVGQKRFSLEGGDALIPMLTTIINRSAEFQLKEIVIGMAHRGRLNVMINVIGKDPKEIFAAFEGKGISKTHSGDVKYHLGFSSNLMTPHGTIHVALAFNPSHLEIVSPVVQGSVRARQRRRADRAHAKVVPIQIHGDAAFSGQGVVMETFNMSQTRWFTVGGSIHIVINNQVGFTTSNPLDARSTLYCTDIAKMVEAPILHVNGNDPEAVYFAALFAIDYRNKFKRDVVIDLVCYRRHGHNEADEPRATQPIMYQVIRAIPRPYELYGKRLKDESTIDDDAVKQWEQTYRDALDQGQAVIKVSQDKTDYQYAVNWDPYIDHAWDQKTETKLPLKQLKSIATALETLPEGFQLQTQIKKVLAMQKKMAAGEAPINWGFAENLAYATLLSEGYPIRLCGQDSGRGTFAHRHAILHNQKTGEIYIPLSHISSNQAQINIVDSLLSEEAVLAFEYGYATADPKYLVIWEAQFGDFANGAQVVIDQFISSGEQKWGRLCGLVMLLPHGYEGQGPEHSSARIERYLQLCAQDNMQVCVPSTPAQIFHLLRRQMFRLYRKPLIVISPKSFLRHPLAVSSLTDLSEGEFQLIIQDVDLKPKNIKRLILCAGKVYYELLEARREKKIEDIAIVRMEQLYPFPTEAFKKLMKLYEHVKDIVWCQEEPRNQGAWSTLKCFMEEYLNEKQTLQYIGRKRAASPAAGYHVVHEKEQKNLISQALTKKGNSNGN